MDRMLCHSVNDEGSQDGLSFDLIRCICAEQGVCAARMEGVLYREDMMEWRSMKLNET